ncbi:MAG: hypothetical protein NXI31_13335 [bacterium]|nr:hypothetical protein [bacterium]
MSIAREVFTAAAAFCIAIGSATGQCAVTAITSSQYGQECSQSTLVTPPTLLTGFDPTAYRLDLWVHAYRGPGLSVQGSVVVLGLQPALLQLPAVPPCRLLATPDIVLYRPGASGAFAVELGGAPPGLVAYAQGAAIFSNPTGSPVYVAGFSARAALVRQSHELQRPDEPMRRIAAFTRFARPALP